MCFKLLDTLLMIIVLFLILSKNKKKKAKINQMYIVTKQNRKKYLIRAPKQVQQNQ